VIANARTGHRMAPDDDDLSLLRIHVTSRNEFALGDLEVRQTGELYMGWYRVHPSAIFV